MTRLKFSSICSCNVPSVPGGGCQFIGEPYEGQETVNGICCERLVDIPLRHWRRTLRLVTRTDWQ
jgi:hypothetical protein